MQTQVKGFQQKTQGDGMFFSIKFGSIVRESKTPQEGFEKITGENRRTKEPYVKYIQRFDTLEALITRIEWYDTEQKFTARYQGFKLYLDANGKKGILDLAINSRTTSRFMKLAENLDFTKPVEFRAWHDSKSDSTALFVGQSGVSVSQKYTRENQGDMPEPKQDFKGNWNYDEQMAFLHKKMMEVVIPKVNASQPDEPENASTEEEHGDNDAETLVPLDPKLIAKVKESLSDLAEHEDYQDKSRVQLMEDFYGTSKFSEIESMPTETIKAVLKKIDSVVVPF